MKITIAQCNPVVGDITGNLAKALEVFANAAEDTDLVILPELYLAGYPPRDLLEKKAFIEETEDAIDRLVAESRNFPDVGIILGAPTRTGEKCGRGLYNSALLVQNGTVIFTQHKSLLPVYDVFDETRYFDPAEAVDVVSFKDEVLGITICEDAWNDPRIVPNEAYTIDPVGELAKKGATIIINISASPFYAGKDEVRYRIARDHARKHNVPFVYVNQVGGNDELIFDGRSIVIDPAGAVMSMLPAFMEEVTTVDMAAPGAQEDYVAQERIASVYDALILGIRDYMNKCGFTKAVVGLSGGVDSALTVTLASAALGPENVLGVFMPSPYTAYESTEYAKRLADNLRIDFKIVPIAGIYSTFVKGLRGPLAIEGEIDTTLENIQARIRGTILMAFSNRFGSLLLSTGNKSELATGYCTLYGDMNGGLAVLSDVPKTMVYELARFINKDREIIPQWIIDRVPSAELKPDQSDQDTLPPYEVLDRILQYYIEEGCSAKEIIAKGFDADVVKWVVSAVDRNEYKRRQAAPGLKVTTKAFGMGRRMPIAARYDV